MMRICMLAYSFYESDNRVMRYAEALAKQGNHVDIIALRFDNTPVFEILNKVNVYRIQKRELTEKNKLDYLLKIMMFFVRAFVFLTKKHLSKRYQLIHVHSVPDFLVFAALIPKLMGSKIILDMHDLVPEFYGSKFNAKQNSIVIALLQLAEKMSAAFADWFIISNHLWLKTVTNRSVNKEKCAAIINYPDPAIFYNRKLKNSNGKFSIIYPGTTNWHQGVDVAIKAFDLIKNEIPNAEFAIYGDGYQRKELEALVTDLGLQQRVVFKKSLPLTDIAAAISESDLGIVPKRKNSFGNEAFSTKILEFMALGIPVVVSDTRIDTYYFDDTLVQFFQSENEHDLARSIVKLNRDQNLREQLRQNALDYIQKNNWGIKQSSYFDIINSLFNHNGHFRKAS